MVLLSSRSELCEDAVRLHRHAAMTMVSQTHLEEDIRVLPRPVVEGEWEIEKPRNENDTSDFFLYKKKSCRQYFL